MNSTEWLAKLVSYDTTSRNSNLPLLQEIQECCENYGLHYFFVEDSSKTKANLFATLPSAQGKTTGGIVFSGHTDVVPVGGQKWQTDPFIATRIDDRIYGRGTCDMKGFLAVLLAQIPNFAKKKYKFPIHFAFSYDEEVGCLGAPSMIAKVQEKAIAPIACIVGEPTNMRPIVAHKGKHSYRCIIQGLAAHSSLTNQGCNAIEYAAALIHFIRNLANRFKNNKEQDDAYDVPFTTLSTNLISGGNAYNTIPAGCEFVFEWRNLPQHQPAMLIEEIQSYIQTDLLPKMHQEYAQANVYLERLAAAPGLEIAEDEPLVQSCRSITGESHRCKVAYATEAGLFQEANIPTLICGPGSIEQAHRENEFVLIEQLQQCESFLYKILDCDFLRI